ncbi:MAG: hypothetical protein WC107_06105 [Patescibacteria group bacterium]
MTGIDQIIATARRDSRCVSGVETLALCGEIEKLRKAFSLVTGYALTCKRKNQREWMFGLEAAINRAAEMLGDSRRAVCGSDGEALWFIEWIGGSQSPIPNP